MASARFPVDFSFYDERSIDQAAQDFSEIANFRREGDFLAVETIQDENPETVFDEFMNYAVSFPHP